MADSRALFAAAVIVQKDEVRDLESKKFCEFVSDGCGSNGLAGGGDDGGGGQDEDQGDCF